MSIKPTRTPPKKLQIKDKIEKLAQKWSDDPQKNLKKLKQLTKQYEKEISKKDVDDLFTRAKKYTQQDIRDARAWFKTEFQNLLKTPHLVNHREMSLYTRRQPAITKFNEQDIGKLFFYKYDPKTKKTLPYYDIFPLIIFVAPSTNGSFFGINIHYLPYKQRFILLYRLMINISDTKLNNHTRLNINYQMLKSASKYKYFQPCFKKYLYSHVRSSIRPVPIRFWANALLLPTARFKKASAATVWADSMRIANRR